MKKSINGHNLRSIRIVACTLVTIVTLFSACIMASATVTAYEKKVLLSMQHYPDNLRTLLLTPNPYEERLTIIGQKIEEEAPEGFYRRLMTHDESVLKAKNDRFNQCYGELVMFIGIAANLHAFTTGKNPLTKAQLLPGYGVDYPFTEEQTNDGDSRPRQIALELAWQYKGRENADAHVDIFFKTCLAIPMSLYYWEDEYLEDDIIYK